MALGPLVDPHFVKVAVAWRKVVKLFHRVLLVAILEMERHRGMPIETIVV